MNEPVMNKPVLNDIVDLQKRVETVGDHFSQMAEQHRTDGMRLARLLDNLEKRFSRSRLEIDRLNSELTRSKEENQQLRGLVQSLIDAAETCEQADSDEAMSGLEQRISSLLSETTAEPGSRPAEDKADDRADDRADDEGPPSEPEGESESAAVGPTVEPSAVEPLTPAAVSADDTASPAPTSEEDITAVNRIIQRISLLTGDFVDQKERTPKGETAKGETAKSGTVEIPAAKTG